MSKIVLGVDLGTTTITALAWEPATGSVVAADTAANDAEATRPADKAQGRSEWDADRIVDRACACIRAVVERLGERARSVAGVGITNQQHGVLIVDRDRKAMTPLVNWQDRRGDEPLAGSSRTFVEEAILRVGPSASQRTGCRLATGYMGLTMFWWKTQGLLPSAGTACFIGDYLGSALTERPPASDPTNAASSGLLDVQRRSWDRASLEALGLPAGLFPEIREADEALGGLGTAAASETGLSPGVPVFVALGDSQAAFLGSIESREHDVLVNVGTGAQVVAAFEGFAYVPPLEIRPLPRHGNLLVSAQPCGGRAYAVLEEFFRKTLKLCGGVEVQDKIYPLMNRLAESVPAGADGLRCRPLFTGTRADPQLRASWTGMSPENFSPAHMARALLEGIAEVLHEDYLLICRTAGKSYGRVVGSGNGVRRNPLFQAILATKFAVPLSLPPRAEEAAVGAARMAALGASGSPRQRA
jgi:sedoheptulokinase